MEAQLKTAQAATRPKFLIELAKPTQVKIVFKKFPTLLKKIKNATHIRHSMTQKLNTDNGLQGRTTRTTGYNSTYPKGGVSCSKDSFVVNQTLVFQIKICGKSPALRVAAKRYSCNPNRRHNRHQTNNKTDDKMPTLRKIKRAAMQQHRPTQIAAHLILPNRTHHPTSGRLTI